MKYSLVMVAQGDRELSMLIKCSCKVFSIRLLFVLSHLQNLMIVFVYKQTLV